MTAQRCALGYDADDAARALAGELPAQEWAAFEAHAESCGVCAGALRATNKARQVWRRAIERDDSFGLQAREARLTSASRVPQVRAGRVGALALGVALGTLAMLGRAKLAEREEPLGTATISTPALPPAPLPPPAPARVPSEALVFPKAGEAPRLLIRSCRSCARPITEGTALARGGAGLDVASGARLLVAWTFREEAPDSTSTVEIEGPALVSAADDSATPALVVRRGTARADVAAPHELRTDLARTTAEHGAWSVAAFTDRSRVEVTAGEVTVTPLAGGAPVVLHAGEALDVAREGHAPPVVAAAARVESDLELWVRSDRALERSDRIEAERALGALLARSGSPELRERASLRLAELELARGDGAGARGRLAGLLAAREPALAADAALLLARAQATPDRRAATWREYLSTAPPSPYRERAAIERAEALLEAGDVAGARGIVGELEGAPALPDVVKGAVAWLRSRLTGGRDDRGR
ncbi:MAG TPA: hypothetical protein VGI39_36520 [Polyangiaceae bacterium]